MLSDLTASLHPHADVHPNWRVTGEENGADLGLAPVLQSKIMSGPVEAPRVKPFGHHFGFLFNMLQLVAIPAPKFLSQPLSSSLMCCSAPVSPQFWIALII